jgi:hypothetical protein
MLERPYLVGPHHLQLQPCVGLGYVWFGYHRDKEAKFPLPGKFWTYDRVPVIVDINDGGSRSRLRGDLDDRCVHQVGNQGSRRKNMAD